MAWVHRLSEIDPAARTARCAHCGPVRIVSTHGTRWACRTSQRSRKRGPSTARGKMAFVAAKQAERAYRELKGDLCERCGFVPEDPAQLDVHHIDGDHHNSHPSNLRTLCANCHRLVTVRDRRAR